MDIDAIIASVIGAIVGALISGAVVWKIHKNNECRAIVKMYSDFMSNSLNAYKIDEIVSINEVKILNRDWSVLLHNLNYLGFSNNIVSEFFTDYCQSLTLFLEGKMERGELEVRRAAT